MAMVDPGSSPPTRGTRKDRDRPGWRARFIPAYAGNTRPGDSPAWSRPVHPRLRGEHRECVTSVRSTIGSSPPTRGTLNGAATQVGVARFIPAYAGNTRQSAWGRRPPPVHPRLRGEHIAKQGNPAESAGSSPPTRGTRFHSRSRALGCRFIPAYAGNTVPGGPGRRRWTVHPRLRGEHSCHSCPVSTPHGSSPPTRGTPQK